MRWWLWTAPEANSDNQSRTKNPGHPHSTIRASIENTILNISDLAASLLSSCYLPNWLLWHLATQQLRVTRGIRNRKRSRCSYQKSESQHRMIYPRWILPPPRRPPVILDWGDWSEIWLPACLRRSSDRVCSRAIRPALYCTGRPP